MKMYFSQFPAVAAARAAACLALIAAVSAASAQGGERFTPRDYHGWSNGAAGSSGGTIYASPNPYQPQTLAPLPEISGNYATHYLFSPETGQTYADPMFYHGLGALDRWDAIQSGSRSVLQSSKRSRGPATVTRTRTETVTTRRTNPTAAPTAQTPPMAALQEIVDK